MRSVAVAAGRAPRIPENREIKGQSAAQLLLAGGARTRSYKKTFYGHPSNLGRGEKFAIGALTKD